MAHRYLRSWQKQCTQIIINAHNIDKYTKKVKVIPSTGSDTDSYYIALDVGRCISIKTVCQWHQSRHMLHLLP